MRFRNVFLLLSALLLGACTATVALPGYQSVTTEELSGSVSVREFLYTPRSGVEQNEIRETAAGRVFVTEPIGVYFTNAVRRELRQASVTLRDGECALDGTIYDFALESLGFEATYITEVTYRLARADGTQLVERPVRVSFKTSKFLEASLIMAAIGRSVSDNIAVLLADPAFRNALERDCTPRSVSPTPVRPARR
jgi:hypothetical protein